MTTEWRSGHCGKGQAPDSEAHKRCVGALTCVCDCHPVATVEHLHPVATPVGDPVATVSVAVAVLEAALGDLLDACTDPEAADMAELLFDVQAARIRLQGIERDAQAACAKAMTGDQVLRDGLRVERTRANDRKAWEHDEWQRDVRAHALRKLGLHKAQGVINADGEVLDAGVLHTLLATVQGAHGSAGPKVTVLRELGMDARDYCETTPGAWAVKVQRIAVESAPVETEQATS